MKTSTKKLAGAMMAICCSISMQAQLNSEVSLNINKVGNVIPKEIYGQFSEHLGQCIYGGLWVGEKSQIPNEDGYRKDVLQALKDLHVPVLRWPGGCFADEYHWMDGIGPRESRPTMVNTNWRGTVEDNSFGTHEFLNLCEKLGCEPYISGNVGSGTVEELAKWVEYMTCDGNSPMANLRRKNGREKPWKVKYLGVGNESWGCGGNMRPEFYSDQFRRYSTYCRNYSGNVLYKVASGASDYDYNWTKVCLNAIGNRMSAISLHYYSVINGWDAKGKATDFTAAEYLRTLGKCCEVEDVLKKHIAIMDELDPKGKIDLLLDEWGTWWDVEEGTNPGWLFQQNTMRDAVVASLSLDIFHKYTRRLKMANIAQIVNVLQSMILTDQKGNGHMVLTPTYHVFRMYNVHQDATNIPLDIKTMYITAEDGRKAPMLSATASKDKNGKIHLSMTNASPDKTQTITLNVEGMNVKEIEGEILQAKAINAHNTFEKPTLVAPTAYKGAKISKGILTLTIPAYSIITVELK